MKLPIDAPEVELTSSTRAEGILVRVSPKQMGQVIVLLLVGVAFLWYEQQNIKHRLEDLGEKLDRVIDAVENGSTGGFYLGRRHED